MVKNTAVTKKVLQEFEQNLNNLTYINIENTNVTDIGIRALTNLPRLENLNINSIPNITGSGLNEMSNLKKLDLGSLVLTLIRKS